MGKERLTLDWMGIIVYVQRQDFRKDKAQDAYLRINLKFTLHLSSGVEKQTLAERK